MVLLDNVIICTKLQRVLFALILMVLLSGDAIISTSHLHFSLLTIATSPTPVKLIDIVLQEFVCIEDFLVCLLTFPLDFLSIIETLQYLIFWSLTDLPSCRKLLS